MNDFAISFSHISKQYQLGRVGTGTLGHDLNRWWQTAVLHHEDPYLKVGEVNRRDTQGQSDFVWALRDITFDVQPGEVVGIIGKNGAGKSTLLKLLSHITSPTAGRIDYRGRIASLLEVGTGFHNELTGRENIYMNGTILGMTRREVKARMDEIVAFSGVERYLDTPVKRYSSGMKVRLGFAVAAFLEPEILVVDEVLAVGDAEFQRKAIGKVKDVSAQQGRTVLFVSHNLNAVRAICQRGIVLQDGMLDYDGDIVDALEHYVGTADVLPVVSHAVTDSLQHRRYLQKCVRPLEITEAEIMDYQGPLSTGDPLQVRMHIRRLDHCQVTETSYSLILTDSMGERVTRYNSRPIPIPEQKTFDVTLTVPYLPLARGTYAVSLELSHFDYTLGSRLHDAVYALLTFEVKYTSPGSDDEYLKWKREWGLTIQNDHDFIVTF